MTTVRPTTARRTTARRTTARRTTALRTTVALGLSAGACVLLAAPASAAPSGQDATWVRAAHRYNLTEIAAGEAAQTRASSATVKELGRMFVADHTRGDTALRATARTLGITLPTRPDAMQRAELASDRATTGAAFDALFLRTQTAGHRAALAAGKIELAGGSDARVLAAAKGSAPVVQAHIDGLLAAQGASSPTSANAGSGGQAARSGTAPLGVTVAGLGLVLVAGAGSLLVRRARAGA